MNDISVAQWEIIVIQYTQLHEYHRNAVTFVPLMSNVFSI